MKKFFLFIGGVYVGCGVFIGLIVGSINGLWAGVVSGALWPIGLIVSVLEMLK